MATRWGWLPRKAARNQLHLSLPIGIYPFARFKIVELHAYFLEKEMATHSTIFAWKIPWTEEPGRLQPTGSQRVGHN